MNYEIKYPCGKLYTITGQEYFLLSPHPLPKDSWQLDQQQMWNVVPNDYIDSTIENDKSQFVYSYARLIVTTNPTVEFLTIDPIYVRVKELQEEFEPVVPAPENVWPVNYTIDKPNKDVEIKAYPLGA